MRIAPHRPEMLRASYASSFRRRERGFSIIELLIVLAIMAVIVLAATPWFIKISQRNEVRSAASEFAITLAAARMRAVKRNLPARVVVTRNTGVGFHLVETFENTQPTPLKVGEVRISARVDFPPTIPAPYTTEYRTNAVNVTFGPDGRCMDSPAPTFTIQGPVGAGTINNLPIQVSANGKIEVLKPNPTDAQKRGTDWH